MKTRTAKRQVVLQLPQPVLEAIDELATRKFTTRSEFIRSTMLKELENMGICPLVAA